MYIYIHIYRYICTYIYTYIYMPNASDKIWINENDFVEVLPFPDMTRRGNQYKCHSEL